MVEVDADGERPNEGGFATPDDLALLLVDAGFDRAIDRLEEECDNGERRVKTKQVIAEQAVEQLFLNHGKTRNVLAVEPREYARTAR